MSEQELVEFVDGSASHDRMQTWQRHVEHCPDCKMRIVEARAGQERANADGASARTSQVPATQSYRADNDPAQRNLKPGSQTNEALWAQDSIEGYKLLRELHRGGQGVVYQAVQRTTKRKVALKVMLEGPFASAESRRRFEREIELLASLHHPNIVPVFDSGVSQGRVYYAMAYIRGERLTDYVRARQFGIDDTLRLFKRVCDAVDYAHQRGVIHRDLKPSNILVDDGGEPQVLDFGLAKVAGPEAGTGAASMLASMTGQVMGTPAYMSPEQAAGRPDQVDLRSDVFSLGVILYELLARRHPCDLNMPIADLLKSIQQDEPLRPSATGRQITDEVETIVLKAMSKEKSRRYATGGVLGQDIGHYLAGEAIDAKRDSALYLLKKSLRRYKAPVMVGLWIVAMMLASVVVTNSLWLRAVSARNRSVQAEMLAQQRLGQVAAAKEASDKARAVAEAEKIRAETEMARADTKANELRAKVYLYDIMRADRALANNLPAEVRELLDGCPADFRGWEWYRLNWLADRSKNTLSMPDRTRVYSLTPDQRHIVSDSWDYQLLVMDLASGEIAHTLKGHTGRMVRIESSAHEGIVASGTMREIILWNVQTGEKLCTLTLEGRVLQALSPDGLRIACSSRDGDITLYEVATGAEQETLVARTGVYGVGAFSPDGTIFASCGLNSLRAWDITSGTPLWEVSRAGAVLALKFSPDGSRIVTGGIGPIEIWNAMTGDRLSSFVGHEGATMSLAYSPDGARIASAGPDRTVKVWNVSTGALQRSLRGHAESVFFVAFSQNGNEIISAAADGIVKTWDPDGPGDVIQLVGHELPVTSVSVSPDNRRIASCSTDKTVRIWSADTAENLLTLRGDEYSVGRVAYSPDGSRIASAGRDGIVRVLDSRTGQSHHTLRVDGVQLYRASYNRAGDRLAAEAEDGTIRFWDAETGRELEPLRGHIGAATFAYSNDGTRIVTGGLDNTLRLWDAATGEMLWYLEQEGAIYCVAISKDGARLATGETGTIRLRDMETGEQLRSWRAHASPVSSVKFAPDGKRIVSCAGDSFVTLWDSVSGEEVLTLRDHKGPVWDIALTSDGKTIVSAGADQIIRLWQASPPDSSSAR